jgi:hypothetical protein
MSLHFFELKKVPKEANANNMLLLWLALFRAETEEELKQIELMEVPVMNQAINAYHQITVTSEFREAERLRSIARHNEAAALRHVRQEEQKKWQSALADKDAKLADKDAKLADKDAKLADQATIVADQAAEIARLREQLTKEKR